VVVCGRVQGGPLGGVAKGAVPIRCAQRVGEPPPVERLRGAGGGGGRLGRREAAAQAHGGQQDHHGCAVLRAARHRRRAGAAQLDAGGRQRRPADGDGVALAAIPQYQPGLHRGGSRNRRQGGVHAVRRGDRDGAGERRLAAVHSGVSSVCARLRLLSADPLPRRIGC
jgi:hypothetical protein